MEQLIYTINGKNYLLFDMAYISMTEATKQQELINTHQGIVQGIKEINRGGLFGETVVMYRVLIPEENALAFSNDNG